MLIIIAFFLPWFSYGATISGWDLGSNSAAASSSTERLIGYAFLLIPISALVVLLFNLTSTSSAFFFRLLPFLITLVLSVLFVLGEQHQNPGVKTKDFLEVLGTGYYINAVGCLLLLFI